jgi:hypothetical protein
MKYLGKYKPISGQIKNGQQKPAPKIDKTAILKPPPIKPKK